MINLLPHWLKNLEIQYLTESLTNLPVSLKKLHIYERSKSEKEISLIKKCKLPFDTKVYISIL